MEFNSQLLGEDQPYSMKSSEVQFFKENLTINQLSSYVYIQDETIKQFLNEIHSFSHASTMIICQDFFYQKIDAWCEFQDQIAQLFTHLPCFDNLSDLYIKLDIYSPNPNMEFRMINLDNIKIQGCPMVNRSFVFNDNQVDANFNNIFSMLSQIQQNNFYLNKKLNVHIMLCISQDQNTKHFIDSISLVQNLKSLDIKYYCESIMQQNINDNQISNNRFLFFNLLRQISKCQSLQNIKLVIPNLNQVQPIQAQDNHNNPNSFNQEVLQLTSSLSMCKNLQQVSLQLPIQFFFQDYLKQKNSSQKSIQSSLKSLSNLKKIKVFELHLIKFKNTPNMRRKTQQINDLSKYLKKQILQNLSHLVLYQS